MPHPLTALPRRAARVAPARRARTAATVALALTTVALASACGAEGPGGPGGLARSGGPDAARSPRRLALGIAFDPRRPGMDPLVAGVEQAVAEWNARPDVRARGLVLAVRRVPPAVTGSARIAERLRDDPEVLAIIGDVESGRTLDAIPTIEDRDRDGARALVAISPTASSVALAGRSAWLFRLSPDDRTASRTAAETLAGEGARRVALVYRNDAYGRDWATAFALAFRTRSGEVVARDPYLPGITSWPVYARALARQRPDVVVFPGFAEDAGPFLRALRDAGVDAPVVGGDALAPLADSAAYRGVRFAVPYDPRRPTTAAGATFARTFAERHGTLPGVRAALGYEAAQLIGAAALAVDLDAPDRRRRVRDWLAGLGRTLPAAAGLAGPVAFDATHAVIGRGVRLAAVGETADGEILDGSTSDPSAPPLEDR